MRRITFAEGEYYHIYNRGVDKRRTFLSAADYKRFLSYLLAVNTATSTPIRYAVTTKDLQGLTLERREPIVAIGAYCLMPNHFHLYLTPLAEDGISRFMQRLTTAYTMYFNEKYERSGSLFQGTFKAEHVATDVYAKYLFSYIHLNPAKIKNKKWKEGARRDLKSLKEFISAYPYSSLGEYRSGQHHVTAPGSFPEYLSNAREVEDHIDYWLRFRHLV